jgi:WD40 repeat protein
VVSLLKKSVILVILLFTADLNAQILIYGDNNFTVSGSVTSMCFSNDNRFIACGTQSGSIHLWDIVAKKQLYELKHGAAVNSLIIDSRSQFVISGGSNKKIIIWDLYTGNIVKEIDDYKGSVINIAMNRDENIISVCGSKEDISLFQFPQGTFVGLLRNGHTKGTIYSAFSKSGDQLISIGKDNQLILWDIATKKVLRKSAISPRTINDSGIEVETAEALPDRSSVLVSYQETRLDKGGNSMIFRYNVAVYNWITGTLEKIIEGNIRNIKVIDISPGGNFYLTDNSTARLKKINFWDLKSGEVVKNQEIGTDISNLRMCKTGEWLAVAAKKEGSNKDEVKLFKVSGLTTAAASSNLPRVDATSANNTNNGINYNVPVMPMSVTGKYYALIIGINEYEDPDIIDLDAPVRDAQNLFDLLTTSYTFNREDILFLKNPKNHQIIEALDQLEKVVTPNDNLLIFYAGHGKWDSKSSRGYWLPSDAMLSSTVNWFRNSTLTEYIASIRSKHTLLIADACFAGSIFKTRSAEKPTRAIGRLYEKPSRKAMTSGTLEEVPDVSVFLKYLSKNLSENQEDYLPSEQLFFGLKSAVLNNSNNIPQFGEVKDAGDEGGDFIFIKRK